MGVVYALMLYEFFMTMYFGIWHQSFGVYPAKDFNTGAAVANTIFFTFFWVMMIWSHWQAVRTVPGYMPLDKESLMEELLRQDS